MLGIVIVTEIIAITIITVIAIIVIPLSITTIMRIVIIIRIMDQEGGPSPGFANPTVRWSSAPLWSPWAPRGLLVLWAYWFLAGEKGSILHRVISPHSLLRTSKCVLCAPLTSLLLLTITLVPSKSYQVLPHSVPKPRNWPLTMVTGPACPGL